jgi:hypothetical protein
VYTFGGDVTIADGKTLVLGGTNDVTLKAGSTVKAGTDTVLTAAGDDVVITPATGAVLTATAATKEPAAPAKIAVGTQPIKVAGTLAVSGELEADAKDITFTKTTGILAIAPGGKVTTKAAAGSGAIILGDSTNGVTLTGAGSWTASGSTVTLSQTDEDAAAISKAGTAAATLTASGTPAITVLEGKSAANVLTLGGGVEINVAAAGSIVLTYHATLASSINFATTSAKITGLKGGAANQTFTTSNITNAATYTVGTATGNLAGGGESGAGKAWIGGGNDTGPNPLKAGTSANVTISKETLIGADA